MTDPAVADRTYVEPLDPEAWRRSSTRAARRPAADAGRADGAQPGGGARRRGRPRAHGVELIGADARGDPHAPRTASFQATHGAAGAPCPRASSPHGRGGRAVAAELGLPLIMRPALHAGRGRAGAPRSPGRARGAPRRARRQPDRPGAGRALGVGLGRDRARGDARRRRQRGRRSARSRTSTRWASTPATRSRSRRRRRSPTRSCSACATRRIAVIRAVGVAPAARNVQFALDPATARWPSSR